MVSGWLDLDFREEDEVKKNVFCDKSFFFKMGGDKKYSPQQLTFFNGRRHEKKIKNTHTHDGTGTGRDGLLIKTNKTYQTL